MNYLILMTDQNIQLYINSITSVINELSASQYLLDHEQYSEAVSAEHNHNEAMMGCLIYCLENIRGDSDVAISKIKEEIIQQSDNVKKQLDVTTDEMLEADIDLLTINAASATEEQSTRRRDLEKQCALHKYKLDFLNTLYHSIKHAEVERTGKTAFISFPDDRYLALCAQFKTKNRQLAYFFDAFTCDGVNDVEFPGPVADSKYYLRIALLNAEKGCSGTQPVEDTLQHIQPTLINSAAMRDLGPLLLDDGSDDDAQLVDVEPPPRCPSALRFL